MHPYGQVYRTSCPNPLGSADYPWGMAFHGILMNDEHKEVWTGPLMGDPVDAKSVMDVHAHKIGISDVRPWTGDLGEKLT